MNSIRQWAFSSLIIAVRLAWSCHKLSHLFCQRTNNWSSRVHLWMSHLTHDQFRGIFDTRIQSLHAYFNTGFKWRENASRYIRDNFTSHEKSDCYDSDAWREGNGTMGRKEKKEDNVVKFGWNWMPTPCCYGTNDVTEERSLDEKSIFTEKSVVYVYLNVPNRHGLFRHGRRTWHTSIIQYYRLRLAAKCSKCYFKMHKCNDCSCTAYCIQIRY